MMSFEELSESGDIIEWDSSMGPVFFISHQWTAFNEPDHSRTQLSTLQHICKKMRAKEFRSLFGTDNEWHHFSTKDPVGAMDGIFSAITEDDLVNEATVGYVWLDYSCVPQAASAQEPRLRAIESIPHYIDACTTFLALCPPVKHKELGHVCDYHTWRKRGWCRLEEQVNELKLFTFTDKPLPQFGPGALAWDVPRRPLMVLNTNHITCVDMFDHFYMLGVRSQTVMNGDFACCSLGHKKVFDDGTEITIPCDKDRIRPFCRQLWQRKSNHFMGGSPMVRHFYAWRYISHMTLMLSTTEDDSPENNDDPLLKTLDDIKAKYFMDEPEYIGMMGMMAVYPAMLGEKIVEKVGDKGQLGSKEFIPGKKSDGLNVGQLTKEDNIAELMARGARLQESLARDGEAKYVNHALAMMIAEGNLKMVKMLVEEMGADVTLGMPWSMCTGIDFAAGKGHVRVLKYLLDKGAICDLNRQSNMSLIGVVDRAAKGGFVEALRMLIEDYGADYLDVVRRNGETLAHSAAMNGHIEVLKYLKSKGMNLHTKSWESVDFNGATCGAKRALDWAKYYYQSECVAFLEADAKEMGIDLESDESPAPEGDAAATSEPAEANSPKEEEERPAEEAGATAQT